MEVSKDGSIITTTHSNIVTFWNSKEYVFFFFIVQATILNYSLSLSIDILTIIKINDTFSYMKIYFFLIFKFLYQINQDKRIYGSDSS